MHTLLARQIRKATHADGTVDHDALLAMVDLAYEDNDRDRRRTKHALDEMQHEVEDLYRRIRQDAEARFNVVMDNVGEAVIIIDEHGIIASFNAAATRIFGYTLDEVIGHNISLLMPEATAMEHDGYLSAYCLTGEAKIIGIGREVIARRKNGEMFPVDLAIGEARDGSRRQFIGVVRDISQRKQAEQALKESESRFRDLVGSASDWFWETDTNHRLTFVSDRISQVLGVKASVLAGLTFFELGMGDDPAAAAEHQAVLDAHQPFRDRAFHVGPEEGKDSRTIRISGVPIHSPEGGFLGYRGIGIDITREAAAERRARLAQQRLADAIESLDDGIAVYDTEDRLVICNKVYRRVFSRPNYAIAPGVSFTGVLDANANVFDIEGMSSEQWRSLRLDHHYRAQGDALIVRMTDGHWFLNRDFRMADGGVVSVRTDITELKLKQQEIETLKGRYELILDSAGEGIVGLDAAGRVTFANRMAGTTLGWSNQDLEHKDFHTLIQPRIKNGNPSQISEAYGQGIGCRVSGDTFHTAHGQDMPVDYYVAPITEGTDSVTGAVVVFRDATLRLQYERTLADSHRELERLVAERTQELLREVEVRARTEGALRESRERLKGITNALFEGVLVVNPDGYIAFANPSARRLLQTEPEADVEGFPLDELFHLGKEGNLAFADSPWREVIRTGAGILDDDATFVLKNGTKVAMAYACSPSAGGGNRAAIISFRDIAALKDAQREALQASRMASVGQLAAGIAHEINTPTQYIGDNLRFIGESFAEMVSVVHEAEALAAQARTAGLAEAAQAFEQAGRNADLAYLCEEIPHAISQSLEGVSQVSRIVLSMKEFSHPGSSSKIMADIHHALENTMTVCRNTWKHVAEMETSFDPTVPPIPCLVGELNQVFLNLIVNAAQAIEASGKGGLGKITISTALDGNDVVIRIADSGNGVPEHLHERIFDPFFTTKDVGKGTGQGLAICRDVVVTKHGGRMTVRNQPGAGAVFTVRLPVHYEEGAAS